MTTANDTDTSDTAILLNGAGTFPGEDMEYSKFLAEQEKLLRAAEDGNLETESGSTAVDEPQEPNDAGRPTDDQTTDDDPPQSPTEEADSKATEKDDPNAAAEKTPAGDQDPKPAPQRGISFAQHRKATRQVLKLERQIQKEREAREAAERRAEAYNRQALVHGVTLSDDIDGPDLSDPEVYAKFAEENPDTAAVLLAQHQQIQALKQQQAPIAQPTEHPVPAEVTDEEIDAAVLANDHLVDWLQDARDGKTEMWELMRQVDAETPWNGFDSVTARYETVASRTLERAKATADQDIPEDAKTAEPPPPPAPASPLQNVKGDAGVSDEIRRVAAMDTASRLKHFDRLERENPQEFQRQIAALSGINIE